MLDLILDQIKNLSLSLILLSIFKNLYYLFLVRSK